MKIKAYKSVREAYESVHKRNKKMLLMRGYSEDYSNRQATRQAVNYAWTEFNIYEEIANVEAP